MPPFIKSCCLSAFLSAFRFVAPGLLAPVVGGMLLVACIRVAHAGETLSRGEIFDALWAGDGSSSENVVDVYLGYLRKKIGAEQEFGFEIKTIRNKGFVIDGLVPTLV